MLGIGSSSIEVVVILQLNSTLQWSSDDPDSTQDWDSVSDDGQGISPDFLPHVFDRFRQQDSTTARQHGGLGLGLAIVRHLVELHGGSVRVESVGEGRGATFTITLPAAPHATPSGESRRSSIIGEPQSGLPSLSGVRVLLVDDLQEARDLISFALVNNGAEVRAAASATEGL